MHRRHLLLALFALAILGACSSAGKPQELGVLEVVGDVPNPVRFTTEEFSKLPHTKVTMQVEGQVEEVEGVPMAEVLRIAGAPFGEALKGPNLTLCVVAEGLDGSEVLFSLTELDPELYGARVMIIDRRNGQELPPGEWPFRVIVQDEKRHGRWVRGVVRLIVTRI